MHQPVIAQRLEAIALFCVCLYFYQQLGFNWLLFIALLFVVDAFMVGYLVNETVGAALYNFGHSFLSPALLLVVGVIFDLQLVYALCIIWFAHISLDRALGYGLKFPGGFTKTHLGMIGGKRSKQPRL